MSPKFIPSMLAFRFVALAATAVASFACVTAGAGPSAMADDGVSGPYHLFNPVPESEMRELSTDRPDKTESAISVDAGHFQMEADIMTYTYDHDSPGKEDSTTREFGFAIPNLKVGLLDNVDLQVIPQSYLYQRTTDRETKSRSTRNGFGDIITRLKVNLWGNDGGETALGLMPYIKVPTNHGDLGNNDVEGGLIVPFGADLPCDWGLGAMTEFDFVSDDDGEGTHTEFVNSITFGHAIVGDLSGYTEFWSLIPSNDPGAWEGTVDLGLTYLWSKFVQLDIGINTGVTQSADDANMFVGYTIKR